MENQILYSMKLPEFLEKIEQIIERRLERLQPQKDETSKYLSRTQVMELLRVSAPTLRDWTRLGWLKSYKIGTRVLYKRKEVEGAIDGLQQHKNKKGGIQ